MDAPTSLQRTPSVARSSRRGWLLRGTTRPGATPCRPYHLGQPKTTTPSSAFQGPRPSGRRSHGGSGHSSARYDIAASSETCSNARSTGRQRETPTAFPDDHVVDQRFEVRHRPRRGDRDREHESFGVRLSNLLDTGPRRCPRRHTIVDEADSLPGKCRRRLRTAVALGLLSGGFRHLRACARDVVPGYLACSTTSALSQTAPSAATAPIAYSGLFGAPIFFATAMSSGASSASATGRPTGSPPRGIARTMSTVMSRSRNASPSRCPAACLFSNVAERCVPYW